MIFVGLLAFSLSMDCYAFDAGNIEIWYQIPVRSFVLPVGDSAASDTSRRAYQYRIKITETGKRDSVVVEGTKEIRPFKEPTEKDYLFGYLPIRLYPGNFDCAAEIVTPAETLRYSREISILPDTLALTASDLIVGFRAAKGEYAYREMPFFPSMAAEFTVFDTVFLFLEIYGLVPDSGWYEAAYRITDQTGRVAGQKKTRRTKYAFTQPDTTAIGLAELESGDYDISVVIADPAQAGTVSRRRRVQVKKAVIDISRMKFYDRINYLVSPGEYKKFLRLGESGKKEYLSKFWARRDYWDFHKRIEEADAKFSLRSLRGRDSQRGRYYIKNGPPEEIEPIHFENWANYMEIWHYIGYDALFCDVKSDFNPVLIKIFKPGELAQKLEFGITAEDKRDWLHDVAPGSWTVPRESDK